jgi:hypothetical protein
MNSQIIELQIHHAHGAERRWLTPCRLRRVAVVYVRHAVEAPEAILRSKQFLVGVAGALGWEPHRVKVIEDIGSGVDGNRRGWQELLGLIRSDKIGAVFVTDVARLSRSVTAYSLFCQLADAHDVALVVSGGAMPFVCREVA